jgi:hypothetical protein
VTRSPVIGRWEKKRSDMEKWSVFSRQSSGGTPLIFVLAAQAFKRAPACYR